MLDVMADRVSLSPNLISCRTTGEVGKLRSVGALERLFEI